MSRPNPSNIIPPLASPLKVGLVGAGYIAPWHAAAVQHHSSAELVAIADVNPSAAKQSAEMIGIAQHFGSVDAMLASADLDVVHVLVPPDFHAEVARQCMRAGLHVFLEKPMGTSSQQCADLIVEAAVHNVHLGINHNFLFSRVYNELRHCIENGKVGRIDAIDIAWNKHLPQLNHGPHSNWMLREPSNLLIELGPHVVSPVLDLASFPEQIAGIASHPITLPGGRSMMRNWAFSMTAGRVAVQTRFSLGSGMDEFYIHVRGSHGCATADIENSTFTLSRSTRYSIDFDRFHRLKRTSRDVNRQAKSGLWRYIGSKLGLCKHGNAYGESISNAIADFYQSLLSGTPVSKRLSGPMGQSTIELCEQLGQRVLPPIASSHNGQSSKCETTAIRHPQNDPSRQNSTHELPCLVLGGTGFIGLALVRGLCEQGRMVRCFVRRPSDVPDSLRHPNVELVQGDMANADDIAKALQDVDGVFHLARGMGKTWDEYVAFDVEPTIQIAKLCMDHHAGRLVYTSSIDAYYAGARAGTITETTPLDPRIEGRNLYAKSKAVIEDELGLLHRNHGLDVVVTRPGIVIGKGGSPFHWGIGMWTGESFCQVWGDGNNKLPIVLVEDVAEGLIAAMHRPSIDGQSFNLIADPVLTANEYLRELQRIAGVRIDTKPTMIWHFYLTDMAKWMVKTAVRHPQRRQPSYRDWESRTQKAIFDCSHSKQVLGWQPHGDRETLIQRGIQDAIEVSMA